MASGDVTLFDEFLNDLGTGDHNLDTDTHKLGLVDSTLTPLNTIATPTWDDYQANEVTTSDTYVANGPTIANTAWTEADGAGKLDGDNVSIGSNASGFTNARWGIIYSSTASNMAIGFLDLGENRSQVAGDVNINWHDTGIFTTSMT